MPDKPKSKTDWDRLDQLTDEEINQLAESDPDSKPMTDEEWAKAKRVTLDELGINKDDD